MDGTRIRMIYIDDDLFRLTPEEVDGAIASLPSQRREALLQYKHDLGRRQGLLAYLLLRKGLKQEYGLEEVPDFIFGEHGKPSLKGRPEIHFNLSHCKTAVACAIDTAPVGIDIESIRTAKETLVRHTMNEQECSLILSSANPDIEFTKLWTRKEAVYKLTGEGINGDIRNILQNCRANIETKAYETYVLSFATQR